MFLWKPFYLPYPKHTLLTCSFTLIPYFQRFTEMSIQYGLRWANCVDETTMKPFAYVQKFWLRIHMIGYSIYKIQTVMLAACQHAASHLCVGRLVSQVPRANFERLDRWHRNGRRRCWRLASGRKCCCCNTKVDSNMVPSVTFSDSFSLNLGPELLCPNQQPVALILVLIRASDLSAAADGPLPVEYY